MMNTSFAVVASLLALSMGPAPDKTPYRQPQLAAGSGMVALAFVNGGSVMISLSSDNGKTFAAPRKVSESPVLAAGHHRGPHVVFTDRAIVVSAVTGKTLQTGEHAHGLPSDGDLLVWRSVDRGKTWSKATVVNDVPSAPREGLHTMVSDGHGQLAAAWLDLRKDGGTQLYGAFSKDDGATWSKNVQLYSSPGGTICQCCGPSLVATGTGSFSVMFRNVMGESRDLYNLQLKDGQVVSKPAKVGTGTWRINACPMDGGGMAFARDGVVSAWRRGDGVFISTPSQPETQVGTGIDIALTTSGGHEYVAFQKGGKVMMWSAGKTQTLEEAGGGFPALIGSPDGSVIAAWEVNGGITTRRIAPATGK